MLMNSFGPNVEFSDEQEKRGFSKICENLNTEYKDHDRKKEQRRLKIDEICRSRQEVFSRSTWWLNFNSFGFDRYGSRRRRQERVVKCWEQKTDVFPLDEDFFRWRVQFVEIYVTRTINHGGQCERSYLRIQQWSAEMLTNSCSPSKMTDGWIYLTYCPICCEMLMNSFGPNVEFSQGKEKRGFFKKAKFWLWRSRQGEKEQRRFWNL